MQHAFSKEDLVRKATRQPCAARGNKMQLKEERGQKQKKNQRNANRAFIIRRAINRMVQTRQFSMAGAADTEPLGLHASRQKRNKRQTSKRYSIIHLRV
jgi:hypothetical protein